MHIQLGPTQYWCAGNHPVAQRGRTGMALERLEQSPFFRGGQEPGRLALETMQPDRARRVVRSDTPLDRPGKERPKDNGVRSPHLTFIPVPAMFTSIFPR